MQPLSEIFRALEAGEEVDTDQLLPLVYDELRSLAGSLLAHEMPGQTLQATALVHEAYVRLIRRPNLETNTNVDETNLDTQPPKPSDNVPSDTAIGNLDTGPLGEMNWNSKAHFFGAAAEAMRRILIDNARRKKRLKRGGDRQRVDLEPAELIVTAPPDDLLFLDEALTRLERDDPEKAKIVKLRYFAGLNVEETAKALGISTATVKRHWAFSKAWLRREMNRNQE